MKAMVWVGNDKEQGKSVVEVSKAICLILEAGYEFRHDQATVLSALSAFKEATSINGVTISGSNFYGNLAGEEE